MNQFLIANAQRCIGCRTCEVACAVAHQQAQDVAALSTNHFAPRIRVVKAVTYRRRWPVGSARMRPAPAFAHRGDSARQ